MRALSSWRTAVLLIALVTRAAAAANPKELFAAVVADDATQLEKALQRNPDAINTKGPGGQTPLMHAVLTGKLISVKVLLGHGADTTIGEKDGYTPMHGAGFQVCLTDTWVNSFSARADWRRRESGPQQSVWRLPRGLCAAISQSHPALSKDLMAPCTLSSPTPSLASLPAATPSVKNCLLAERLTRQYLLSLLTVLGPRRDCARAGQRGEDGRQRPPQRWAYADPKVRA